MSDTTLLAAGQDSLRLHTKDGMTNKHVLQNVLQLFWSDQLHQRKAPVWRPKNTSKRFAARPKKHYIQKKTRNQV